MKVFVIHFLQNSVRKLKLVTGFNCFYNTSGSLYLLIHLLILEQDTFQLLIALIFLLLCFSHCTFAYYTVP